MTIKILDETGGRLEILAIPYGGPIRGRDLSGEAFAKTTDLELEMFPGQTGRPVYYEHKHHDIVGRVIIGREVKNWEAEAGRFIEAEMDRSGNIGPGSLSW